MSIYPLVTRPDTGPSAFQTIGEAASQSQAAIFLLLGQQARGDEASLLARAAALKVETAMEALTDADRSEFPAPQLQPAPRRIGAAVLRSAIRKRYGKTWLEEGGSAWQSAYADVALKLFQKPEIDSAAELMELGLRHPMELVRVSAAASYFSLCTVPRAILRVLRRGTRSTESLVRNVAATALARISPSDPALRRLMAPRRRKQRDEPVHTATLLHGTWASGSPWWQPGGDFHSYVSTLRSDVYGGADRFQWSGGYSDLARLDGSNRLVEWVNSHGAQGLDLFAHSHGGNVSMLATHSGLGAGKLVLLSCPVHARYMPEFSQVQRVISIRVRMDLVILADRGGQKFKDPRIEENVLPIWFSHSATHDPQVWRDHNLAAKT